MVVVKAYSRRVLRSHESPPRYWAGVTSGVPTFVLGTSILSLSIGRHGSHPAMPLVLLTAAIWLSLIVMVAIGAVARGFIQAAIPTNSSFSAEHPLS